MTYKQIIIDGIDVSKCKYFDYDSKECKAEYYVRYGYEIVKYDSCIENPNCYFKQLKRKEQECEELKSDLTDLSKIIDCKNGTILTFKEQLDQLKAENENLTTINARLLGRLEVDEKDTSLVFNLDKELRQKEKEFYTAIQKVVKLKQTLAEIKEIAKQEIDSKEFMIVQCMLNGNVDNKNKVLKQILQKISECEVENAR